MTERFEIGERVCVKLRSTGGSNEFEAFIMDHHHSGYYVSVASVIPTSSGDRLHVNYDEVFAIDAPPKPRFAVGSTARLGSPDGPETIVIAIFSRGALVSIVAPLQGGGVVEHTMEVPMSDLFEPAPATATQGVFV